MSDKLYSSYMNAQTVLFQFQLEAAELLRYFKSLAHVGLQGTSLDRSSFRILPCTLPTSPQIDLAYVRPVSLYFQISLKLPTVQFLCNIVLLLLVSRKMLNTDLSVFHHPHFFSEASATRDACEKRYQRM